MFLQAPKDSKTMRNQRFEELERNSRKKPKPSIEESLVLELKPLPSNLKYVFLDPLIFFPIVIAIGL